MPNPKRRHSKTRRDLRRAHDALTAANVSACGNCGAPVLFHRVCSECGHYRGKLAVEKKTAS